MVGAFCPWCPCRPFRPSHPGVYSSLQPQISADLPVFEVEHEDPAAVVGHGEVGRGQADTEPPGAGEEDLGFHPGGRAVDEVEAGFAGGLDRPYPPENTALQARIAAEGAAKGYGTEKRVLLLHGPVGSSKSTIARLLKKGIERYSRTQEGALYTYKWVNLKETGLAGDQGAARSVGTVGRQIPVAVAELAGGEATTRND